MATIPAPPPSAGHDPVLLKETVRLLAPKPGERIIDLTLGLGGHAGALIERLQGRGEFVGFDADDANLAIARGRLANAGIPVRYMHGNFSGIADENLGTFDVLLADLGLNSLHVDDAARGFSFRFDGPLDLRFDRTRGQTAAERIADVDEETLASVLQEYGELRFAPKLARLLVERQPNTTTALRETVEAWAGWRAPKLLPQVFQALRIWTNDELTALDNLLKAIPTLLRAGGRAGIISFHSLEDRRVKHAFRALSTPPKDPVTGKKGECDFTLVTPHPVRPSAEEIAENPRSRSALLRVLARHV